MATRFIGRFREMAFSVAMAIAELASFAGRHGHAENLFAEQADHARGHGTRRLH